MATKKQKKKRTVKRAADLKPQFEYAVIDSASTTITRHATRDEWDRDDTATEHYVQGIYRVPDREGGTYPYCGGESLASSLDLKVDDTAFLVYVVYSTGDSFGHDEGRCLRPIGLYDSREKAEKVADLLEAHAKQDPNGPYEIRYTFTYPDNDGVERDCHAGWMGYFEHLDEVAVKKVTVLSERDAKRYHNY
jgi:hypothetical protein